MYFCQDNTYSDTVNATPGCDLVRKVISIGGSTVQLIIVLKKHVLIFKKNSCSSWKFRGELQVATL